MAALLQDPEACGPWRGSDPPELPDTGLERFRPMSRLSCPRGLLLDPACIQGLVGRLPLLGVMLNSEL